MTPPTSVVTGAFGYTGKYIARRLLAQGETVLTLTGNPQRPNDLGSRVKVFPFCFERPAAMAESMAGARVLFNTYWVRFDRGQATHERAVNNTLALIEAARLAGVERIVHVSITNPDHALPLPYFRGKALLESAIEQSGLSHTIVRPTVIFGAEDILINNIAFLLRKFPVFLIPGDGQYPIQPVFVEDVAEIAVEAACQTGNRTIDAVGPETFTFHDLVRLIAATVGTRARLLHSPPNLALLAASALGLCYRDVMLTRDELSGLMRGLLVSRDAPTGTTRLSNWLHANASRVGAAYSSELNRHYLLAQPAAPCDRPS